MNILVAGEAGFIGSHVAEYYAGKGEKVIVLDNLSGIEILGKVMGPSFITGTTSNNMRMYLTSRPRRFIF
jgi:nucleoside-diphosphate-sugar epimerase